MEQAYRFSLVIFAAEEEKLGRTYKSIVAQKYPAQDIQVIIVLLQEELKKKELIRQIEQKKNVVLLEAWRKDDIRKELQEKIAGTYVTFQKQGICYDEKGIARIDRRMKKSGASVVCGYVKNNERINTPMIEHNLYCKTYRNGMTLEENYFLNHTVYCGYFLKRENICWQQQFDPSAWYAEILKMLCDTVLHADTISCVRQPCVKTETGADINEEWHRTISNEGGFEDYYKKLLLPMEEICSKDTVKHKKNAEYVMAYYASVLVDKLRLYRNCMEERYAKELDRIMRRITHSEVILNNRYISQLNQGYLMKTYWPEVKPEDSPEAAFALSPDDIRVEVMFFEKKEDKIHTEFFVKMPVGADYGIFCGLEENPCVCRKIGAFEQMDWGTVQTGNTWIYEVDVTIEKSSGKLCWWIEDGERKRLMKNITFRGYTPFAVEVDLYKVMDGSICFLNRGKNAVIMKNNCRLLRAIKAIKRSCSFCVTGKAGMKAVAARILFESRKRRQKKSVWLCSDRTNRADDNGEVMFSYLCEHPDDSIEPYFVIDKNTDDWKRMGKIGKVVETFSKEHKVLFLLSEFSLSSQANRAVINPFGKLEYYYRDLMYDKRLVFLQHGITKDNQSKWLNRYNRNLFGFVVTTRPEYESVFEYDYYYKPERVWLTGMPRYDRLYHDEKKYVTIMPTWRKSLSGGTDAAGVWLLGKDFKKSSYFKFYNELLNDERLLKAAENCGYCICFMPHPNTISGLHYFKRHSAVKFLDMTYSYRDVFAQTDLMVTDYSSVAFDFAYLRKPIVYSQFDKAEFFGGGHSYTEGYFDYVRDGFGEVEETLETVVDRIIEYMENGCRIKPEYRERIDKTFAFDDKDCSRRVYETVLKYRNQ